MAKHTKPTKEELAENIEEATQELEELENESPPAPEPIPEPSKPEPEPEPSTPEPSKPEPSQAVDYKKKFVESTREAQILHSKQKKLTEVIDIASELPDPTEEELRKEFTEWDEMSDTEKKLAKDSFISTKRFAVIHQATKEFKDIDSWNEKIEGFVSDPQTLVDTPELEGKGEEFKVFATKPTRRGVDFKDLVSAFLFEESKTSKPKNKGAMFETGTGGPNDKMKPKSDKITIDQARVLRNTDYKKYTEFLKAGKIDTSDI